jgi:hypothetical protein
MVERVLARSLVREYGCTAGPEGGVGEAAGVWLPERFLVDAGGEGAVWRAARQRATMVTLSGVMTLLRCSEVGAGMGGAALRFLEAESGAGLACLVGSGKEGAGVLIWTVKMRDPPLTLPPTLESA